jgi:hypothetical protein
MTSKEAFTPDEWQMILQSVLATGLAVTAAEPSGLWGLLKEGLASAEMLKDAKGDPRSNELVKAIAADFATSAGRSAAQQGLRHTIEGAKRDEIATRCITVLSEASALLDRKAPNDAAAVRTWLRNLSEHVANAASEGGFLGFGGVPVSDAEKTTLDQISKALHMAA